MGATSVAIDLTSARAIATEVAPTGSRVRSYQTSRFLPNNHRRNHAMEVRTMQWIFEQESVDWDELSELYR
jgi:hypothetical protein